MVKVRQKEKPIHYAIGARSKPALPTVLPEGDGDSFRYVRTGSGKRACGQPTYRKTSQKIGISVILHYSFHLD